MVSDNMGQKTSTWQKRKEKFSQKTQQFKSKLSEKGATGSLGGRPTDPSGMKKESSQDKLNREKRQRQAREENYWYNKKAYESDPELFKKTYKQKTGQDFQGIPPKSPEEIRRDAEKARRTSSSSRWTPEGRRTRAEARTQEELKQMGIPEQTQEVHKIWVQPTKDSKDKDGNFIPGVPGHYQFVKGPVQTMPESIRRLQAAQIKLETTKTTNALREAEIDRFNLSRTGHVVGAARSVLGSVPFMAEGGARGMGAAIMSNPGTSSRLYTGTPPDAGSMRTPASEAILPSGRSGAARALAPGMNMAGAALAPRMSPDMVMLGTPGGRMPYPQVTEEGLRSSLSMPRGRAQTPRVSRTLNMGTRKGQAPNRYKSQVRKIKGMRLSI